MPSKSKSSYSRISRMAIRAKPKTIIGTCRRNVPLFFCLTSGMRSIMATYSNPPPATASIYGREEPNMSPYDRASSRNTTKKPTMAVHPDRKFTMSDLARDQPAYMSSPISLIS